MLVDTGVCLIWRSQITLPVSVQGLVLQRSGKCAVATHRRVELDFATHSGYALPQGVCLQGPTSR